MTNVEPHDAEYQARLERTAELKALGFDPKKPEHRAAVKVAERYGLDLLLKELIVIPGKGAYITRDGLLSIAHSHGMLNGIVLEEQGTDTEGKYWWAVVSVYRKDMQYPFRYPGRYPFDGSNRAYGPEMAIKVAESMALRRAFRISGIPSADEAYDVPEDGLAEESALADMMPDGITEQGEDEY